MYKIQTLNAIAATGLSEFPRELYEIATDMQEPDAILLRSHLLQENAIPHSVKVIGRAGAGVNNIPVAALTKRGIPVFNTPGANANAVRELVIGGMLLASRHICEAWNYVNNLSLQTDMHHEIEKNKKQFVGFELMGKTLGIVGLGSVGVKVANAALHLGMRVIGYDPTITVSRAWELSASVKQAHSMDELLSESEFVSFHVPLNDATKNMINHARFHLMKPGVVLLNFARVGIVDHEALLEAINEKRVFAYVTDFPSNDIKGHPRVISLPHLGASTKEAEENCAAMIAKQVRNYLEHGLINNAVNFPNVDASKNFSGIRLAIVNANIPNMVAQISSQLAHAGLNILSLLNKSLGDIAYTLIDVNSEVDPHLIQQIVNIDGVFKLRRILPLPAR